MLTDEKLPSLPSPEKVLVRLTAMQHIEAERFTLDQMREYGRAAANDALERAALRIIEMTEDHGTADAIRALKTKEQA